MLWKSVFLSLLLSGLYIPGGFTQNIINASAYKLNSACTNPSDILEGERYMVEAVLNATGVDANLWPVNQIVLDADVGENLSPARTDIVLCELNIEQDGCRGETTACGYCDRKVDGVYYVVFNMTATPAGVTVTGMRLKWIGKSSTFTNYIPDQTDIIRTYVGNWRILGQTNDIDILMSTGKYFRLQTENGQWTFVSKNSLALVYFLDRSRQANYTFYIGDSVTPNTSLEMNSYISLSLLKSFVGQKVHIVYENDCQRQGDTQFLIEEPPTIKCSDGISVVNNSLTNDMELSISCSTYSPNRSYRLDVYCSCFTNDKPGLDTYYSNATFAEEFTGLQNFVCTVSKPGNELPNYCKYDAYLNYQAITVDEKSGPVNLLNVATTTQYSAIITWQTPLYPNGNITGYLVEVKENQDCLYQIELSCTDCGEQLPVTSQSTCKEKDNPGSGQTFVYLNTAGNKFTQVLSNLNPDREYTVAVSAVNEEGPGIPGEEKFRTDLIDAPSGGGAKICYFITLSTEVTNFHVNGSQSVVVEKGEDVTFTCQVDDDPPAQAVLTGSRRGQLQEYVTNTDLLEWTLTKVTCQDADRYKCKGVRGSDSTPTELQKFVDVNVVCPPKLKDETLLEKPPTYTFDVVDDIEITIEISGYPEPTEYVLKVVQGSVFTDVSRDKYSVTYTRLRPPFGRVTLKVFDETTQRTTNFMFSFGNSDGNSIDFNFFVVRRDIVAKDDTPWLYIGVGAGGGVVITLLIAAVIYWVRRKRARTVRQREPEGYDNLDFRYGDDTIYGRINASGGMRDTLQERTPSNPPPVPSGPPQTPLPSIPQDNQSDSDYVTPISVDDTVYPRYDYVTYPPPDY